VSNLISAVGRRSSGDYIRTLAAAESGLPAFQFVPDPQSDAANPGAFDRWDLASELRYGQALFTPATLPLDSVAQLELTIERKSSLSDTASLGCHYALHLGHKLANAPRDMSGRAEFTLLKGSDGGWYIQRWVDLRDAGAACWSDLKAAF